MESFENKTGMGSRDFGSEAERLGKRVAEEGERFGKRVADKVGSAVGAAGQKLDAAIDYVDSTTQTVRESITKIREEGWQGVRERTVEYTRKEPIAALCIAMSAGILLGWLTKRGR